MVVAAFVSNAERIRDALHVDEEPKVLK